jgi:hypothetical protein
VIGVVTGSLPEARQHEAFVILEDGGVGVFTLWDKEGRYPGIRTGIVLRFRTSGSKGRGANKIWKIAEAEAVADLGKDFDYRKALTAVREYEHLDYLEAFSWDSRLTAIEAVHRFQLLQRRGEESDLT